MGLERFHANVIFVKDFKPQSNNINMTRTDVGAI
jgi:hypothetical protein